MKTILVDTVDCFVSKDGQVFEAMHNLFETYPNRKIILTGANDEQFRIFGLDKMPYEVFTLKHNPEKRLTIDYQSTIIQLCFNRNTNLIQRF